MKVNRSKQREQRVLFQSPLSLLPLVQSVTLRTTLAVNTSAMRFVIVSTLLLGFVTVGFSGEETQVDTEAPSMDVVEGQVAEPSPNRFRFTTIRTWVYRDFLPDSRDSDVLGLEFNSAWGLGDFDVANISYLEFADYARAVPGKPAGNPEPGSEAATGITDLLSAFLFSRKSEHHGPHHFAYGLASQFPTASDDTLGSGKWALGPAIEYEYHRDRFYGAFVALQLWSVAGDADRKDVSMLMIKPMVTYDLGKKWKAVYMPYGISVYWNKPASDAVYLPLGGGIQRDFRIGSLDMAASVQFFKYVVRPSEGSEYDLRFMLEFDF